MWTHGAYVPVRAVSLYGIQLTLVRRGRLSSYVQRQTGESSICLNVYLSRPMTGTGRMYRLLWKGDDTNNSSADISASVRLFCFSFDCDWNTNTWCVKQCSAPLPLGSFMENVHGHKQRTFYRFAVPFSLHKSFIVGLIQPGFMFLCKYLFVFLSLSICRLRLTLLVFWQHASVP